MQERYLVEQSICFVPEELLRYVEGGVIFILFNLKRMTCPSDCIWITSGLWGSFT